MNATLRPALTILVLVLALPLAAAERDTDKANDAPVRFERRQLLMSPNEGCALADVDRDGLTDIIAGTHWFAAPDFAPRPVRTIREFSDDFLANNGDHPYDVNGDGWTDVISGEWMGDEVYWYENPGAEWLAKGLRWKPHLLKKTRGENEANFLRDLNGDGIPELVVDSWEDDAPLVCWQLAKDADGQHTITRVQLGAKGCGHGMAFGDINGDGREDILVKVGWYECPTGDPLASEWKLHRDWDRPHGATPHLVVDLSGDGHNDIIWGNGHDFGLYWYEQGKPDAAGKTAWTEHLIDNEYSQTHSLVWIDIDGDGDKELITGKRVRGHAGRDPGGFDPECLYYYKWHADKRKFSRHEISPPGGGVGTGMQINTADLNGDGLIDIAVGGKSGTWLLLNQGR